jgi:phage tail sheath protein FI
MPEYLAPGVFVEEVSFRPSQIQPASTSVAAMVGPTRTGLVRGLPQLLTSFADFQRYYGDTNDLNFGGTTVTNYTAYAARAFFDSGGQQLYLARVTRDIETPSTNSPQAASLAVPDPNNPGPNNTLLIFGARFPGAASNVDLVLRPRRSQRLLELLPPTPSASPTPIASPTPPPTPTTTAPPTPTPTNTVVLRLTNVPASAMVGNALDPAATYPLQSLIAIANLAPASTPPQYNFVIGQQVLYVNKNGQSQSAQVSAFATGILQSAVPTGAAQAASFQAPSGIGSAPVYSIPVGPNLRLLLNIGDASVTTLYGTVSGNPVGGYNVTLSHALNPSLSADVTAPLALLAMGSRTGDGNIYHDSYDISVQLAGAEIYSFADVDIEPDAANSLAAAMPQSPVDSTANATQPVYAAYVGSPTVPAIWGGLLGAFDTNALHPSNPAVAPSFVLHLVGGNDGQATAYADYVGMVDELSGPGHGSFGIAALESINDISIVLCPAAAADPSLHQAVISAIQAHCTKMLYRVGVIESPLGASIADAQAFAGQFADTRLAFYYPWISVASLGASGGNVLLPPSGFVAGLYAYTDITRGVYKAPANVVVQEAIGLEVYINTAQQEVLNPLGINCIRSFPSRGILVWGARTLSSDPQWQYVNVRRYFLYLEQSIADSTSWVVFEPNGEALWSSVATTIDDFLYNEWFNGRLMGDRPNQAYFVRCDRSTMTQADIDNGRLICVIGVAPLEPAEFVIFRIGQWTASA